MVDRGCSQNGFARLTGSTFTSAGSTVSACLRQAGVAFSHGKSQGRNDREQKTSSTQIVSRRIRKPIGEQLIPSAIPENLRPAMIINSKSSSTDAVPRKVSEDFRGTPLLPLALLLPPAAAHRKVALFHGDFRARNENKTNSIVHRSFSLSGVKDPFGEYLHFHWHRASARPQESRPVLQEAPGPK